MSDFIKRLAKVHHHNNILDAFLHVESDTMNKLHKLSFAATLFMEAMLQWVILFCLRCCMRLLQIMCSKNLQHMHVKDIGR